MKLEIGLEPIYFLCLRKDAQDIRNNVRKQYGHQ